MRGIIESVIDENEEEVRELANYFANMERHFKFSDESNGDEDDGLKETVLGLENGFVSPFNNNTTYMDDLFPHIPLALTRFATVSCITFILLGVPGNLLTIIALARCKKVHNATAYFIMNLSACDLLFCCFNLPLAVSMFLHRSWVHGDALCVLFPFFRYGLMAVSIFTVLAITINRYVMIGHPRIYPRMYDSWNLVVMIIFIWMGAFGAIIPTLLKAWGQFALDKEIGSCSIVLDNRGRSPKTFLFVVAFVLPCCAIILCYARIFCIVRQATLKSRPIETTSSTVSRGNTVTEPSTSSTASEQRMLRNGQDLLRRPSVPAIQQKGKMTTKDRKLLWMILVIFGTFLLCHLPITLLKLFKGGNNSFWNIIGLVLIYSTTCVNPIIYVVMSQEYRQAYKGLIFCKAEWTLNSRSCHCQSATYHQATENSNQTNQNNNIQTDSSSA